MFEHQSSGDLDSRLGEINDSCSSFPFGFLFREQPTTVFQIDMPCFNSKQFLRTRTTFPGYLKQLTEFVIVNRIDDLLVLFSGNALVSSAALRLFQMGDWISLDVAHLLRPAKWSLNGNDATAFVAIGPIWMSIDPFLHMEGLQLINVELRGRLEKPLATFAIPVVSSSGAVLQRPLKKRIKNPSNGVSVNCPFRGTGHQLVKTLKSTLAIWAEVMPLAIDRDEPRFSLSTIPRFW